MNYNRILFLGFRCSGKTTISTEVARILNFELLDTDIMIQQESGKTINEITQNGRDWAKFRELETLKIKGLLDFDNVVISAGGGVGVNNINYSPNLTYGELQKSLIQKSIDTLKILLVADDDVIRQRLFDSKRQDRPDLGQTSKSIDDYIENNIKIMKERENDYREMADLIYDTSDNDVEKNANNIIDIINKKYSRL